MRSPSAAECRRLPPVVLEAPKWVDEVIMQRTGYGTKDTLSARQGVPFLAAV